MIKLFLAAPVSRFKFERERGKTIAKLDILRRERRFVDAAGQVQIRQTLLLVFGSLNLN